MIPGHSGVVVWLTGLPSSGKSTLARRLDERLRRGGTNAVILDGDEVRAALVPPPGYDGAGRATFYATLGRLAALLAKQGHVAIVAATANRRAYRDAARAIAPRFIEVFVATPAEECRRRDAKGLYAASAAGMAQSVPGAGVEYEAPARPEVVARDGEDAEAVERIALAIMA